MTRLVPCLLAAASAALLAAAEPVAPPASEIIARLKPGHPRLLIDTAGFEQLGRRAETDETLKAWDRHLRAEADKVLASKLPRHEIPDGLRLLATSRRVLGHTYTLALMYRLHGDRRYADRLWQEMQAVAAFDDWNPRHFLDTAEMTHAVAIAYDWLFDTWTPEQKRTLREAIVRHGLEPGLDVYRRARWWARCDHNWNQVCNGGLTVGALAVGDEEPQRAGEILHHAVASLPLAMRSYAPDGAWGEGPGYWSYATTYNVLMLAALDSALGTDFGLSGTEAFSETGLFPISMAGPSGRTFNFSDSSDRLGGLVPMLWLGERFGRPVYSWFAVAMDRPSAAAMVWYRRPGLDPAAAGLPLDKYWRGVEVVTMRSAWNDFRAIYVGIQAGSNRVNHNHLDLGSFVLDALGQRWAVDLGGDSYNLPGYFGRNRYDYYRLRAEGHNTLVINPGKIADQDPRAAARIRSFATRADEASAVADLTPAYAAQARRVERGVAMLERRAVLLQDEVEAAQADLWWFLHTTANVSLAPDGRQATLTIGRDKLQADLLSPAGARFEVLPAKPLPTSPDPAGQRDNKGFCKLAVHLAGVDQVRLAVLFAVPGEKAPAARPKLRPLAEW